MTRWHSILRTALCQSINSVSINSCETERPGYHSLPWLRVIILVSPSPWVHLSWTAAPNRRFPLLSMFWKYGNSCLCAKERPPNTSQNIWKISEHWCWLWWLWSLRLWLLFFFWWWWWWYDHKKPLSECEIGLMPHALSFSKVKSELLTLFPAHASQEILLQTCVEYLWQKSDTGLAHNQSFPNTTTTIMKNAWGVLILQCNFHPKNQSRSIQDQLTLPLTPLQFIITNPHNNNHGMSQTVIRVHHHWLLLTSKKTHLLHDGSLLQENGIQPWIKKPECQVFTPFNLYNLPRKGSACHRGKG